MQLLLADEGCAAGEKEVGSSWVKELFNGGGLQAALYQTTNNLIQPDRSGTTLTYSKSLLILTNRTLA